MKSQYYIILTSYIMCLHLNQYNITYLHIFINTNLDILYSLTRFTHKQIMTFNLLYNNLMTMIYDPSCLFFVNNK